MDDLAATLSQHVSPRKWFRWNPPPTEFEGTVTRDGFRLVRTVRGRDSFNPLIRGTFATAPSGALVSVRLWLHPLVWAFLVFWSYFLARPALEGLQAVGRGTGGLSELVPIAMFLSAWVMMVIFFYINAFRIRKLLFQLLELREVDRRGA